MFRRCIACNADLGSNEAVEAFPIGKRLAFDAAKGRLWVVCPACKQWNLSPLEERWEAIEAAEKLYRDAKKRVTTNEVGLARMGDGTDLVRIGEPQRPEFAAWRYGERFLRRRARHLAVVAGTVVAGGAVVIGGLAAGLFAAGSVNLIQSGIQGLAGGYRRLRVATRFDDDDGVGHVVTYAHLRRVALTPEAGDGGWLLSVPTIQMHQSWRKRLFGNPFKAPPVLLREDAAFRMLSRLLPHVNRAGATTGDVHDAVRRLEEGAALNDLAGLAARAPVKAPRIVFNRKKTPALPGLDKLPLELRLALEMSLHEDDERRWLDGDLDELTDRWKEAEEVAAIADQLLLPEWIDERLKGRRGSA